jgi:hypothetical protein
VRQRAQASQRVEAVQPGHAHVEQHQIRHLALEGRERGFARIGLRDSIAGSGEACVREQPILRRVIDDENVC